MKEELDKLKKQVLMLNIGLALVMTILKQKGLVDTNKTVGQAMGDDIVKQVLGEDSEKENSGKEAEYNKLLDELEVKKENLN